MNKDRNTNKQIVGAKTYSPPVYELRSVLIGIFCVKAEWKLHN